MQTDRSRRLCHTTQGQPSPASLAWVTNLSGGLLVPGLRPATGMGVCIHLACRAWCLFDGPPCGHVLRRWLSAVVVCCLMEAWPARSAVPRHVSATFTRCATDQGQVREVLACGSPAGTDCAHNSIVWVAASSEASHASHIVRMPEHLARSHSYRTAASHKERCLALL